MASINGVTGAWTSYEETVKKSTDSGDSLGKEDFLKLLVAQLTHQDPTNPMNDTEFVAQLATYSGLEQQMNMNKNLEKLITATNMTTAASAMSLIGSIVGYTGEDGALNTGQVSFLDIVGGEVNLYLTDGTYIPYSVVEQVGYPITVPAEDES
ncbi:MAG: flagellar hook assembly protein FlgD [Synergistaceae bacterium]|jgi:flagellar basal-body rod modification protein FlgD|nr:flagellar hook assembly protein FlgD [Synergistaceae bacterium]